MKARMFFKAGIYIFVLLAIFSPYGISEDLKKAEEDTREWGPLKEGCQLSIKTEKDKYGYCQPVVVTIVVRNSGTDPIMYEEALSDYDFSLTVKDEKGRDVTLTEWGAKMKKYVPRFHTNHVTLESGKTREYKLIANRLRDMTLGGKYIITAKRSVFKNKWKDLVELESNAIEIRIAE